MTMQMSKYGGNLFMNDFQKVITHIFYGEVIENNIYCLPHRREMLDPNVFEEALTRKLYYCSISAGVLFTCLYAYFHLKGSSIVDFCEINRMSYPIEVMNTMSMLPWIILSMFLLFKGIQQEKHPWTITAYALSLWIAVGSTCLHATLSRFSEGMDELPMYYLTLHGIFGILKPIQKRESLVLFLTFCLFILINYCSYDQYNHFLIPYTTLVGVFLLLFIRLPWTKISILSLCCLFIGYLCWINDFYDCHPTQYYHAIWHLMIMVAIHLWIHHIDCFLKTF